MNKIKKFRPGISICLTGANPVFTTSTLFDSSFVESKISPIDEFSLRLRELNRLSPMPTAFDANLGQLILLGVIAAVESYMRALFRKIIILDEYARECVSEKTVSYGAAAHLDRALLPEALFERVSFTSKYNIVEVALRELLGVKGGVPGDLEAAIDDYVRVCHLRHCTVHRFGRLGVGNAIALGLAEHVAYLEKPLKLDYVALQNGIAISMGLVKTMNNFLFNEVISRVPHAVWTGKYSSDKKKFLLYYNLFANMDAVTPTMDPKIAYQEFYKQLSRWLTAST